MTALLAEGANAIGAVVTSGWWAGAIARGVYGNAPLGFIAKLIVTYDDDTQETLVSDLSWRTSRNGAVRQGDIYDGEIYDARLESGWTTPDFDDDGWNAVEANNNAPTKIQAFTGGYVLQLADKVQHLKTATIYNNTRASGTDYGTINVVSTTSSLPFSLTKGQAVILDFGQNIVGWVRLKVRGSAAGRLHMRFAEMLNDTGEKSRGNDGPGGSLYLANLRTAKAECFYILSGDPDGEAYHPSTTFYGFRYCEIVPTDDVEILSCEAQPISSSTEETGTLSTSNALVNQLISNIQWGQRGNLLSVPTDCPQRDCRTYLPAGGSPITSASATYRSRYGTIASAWTASEAGRLVYECTVPANTTATLHLPAENGAPTAYESGEPAASAEGVTYMGYKDGCQVYELQSGTYRFSADAADGVQSASADAPGDHSIYDLAGRKIDVRSPNDNGKWRGVNGKLPKGIYIGGAKKRLVP